MTEHTAGAGRPVAPAAQQPPPTATLGQFFSLFRRRLTTVVACLLLGLTLAGLLLMVTAKSYEATAVVDVSPVFGTSSSSDSTSSTTTITESRIAASTSVSEIAKRSLGFTGTPSELVEHVVVTSPLDSRVLNVTFSSSTPQGAANGANAFANAYLDYRTTTVQDAVTARVSRLSTQIADYERAIGALKRPPSGQDASQYLAQRASFQRQIQGLQAQINTYQTSVIQPGKVAGEASVPSSASAPKPSLYIAGGLLLGLVLGLFIALFLDQRDDIVHDAATAEEVLGAPVLAETSTTGSPGTFAPLAAPEGVEADAYRTVATTVAPETTSRQVVLVCGAGAATHEAAASNLAITFAAQGLRTVLAGTRAAMDSVADVLGVGPAPGGGGSLISRPKAVSAAPVAHLTLLSLGDEISLGATLRAHGDNLADVLSTADVVVLDCVNITFTSALLRLGNIADEAVIIIQRNQTSSTELERVAHHLAQVGTTVLGSILLSSPPRRRGRRSSPATPTSPAAPSGINIDRYDIASRNAFRREAPGRAPSSDSDASAGERSSKSTGGVGTASARARR
ncbi:hypothetical protein KRR39_00395 [Nocardioides panacis]|uniref:Polysaccharide chain length determinant N-terminal domain-containing protein n=1 Tax=Nocardioides panacis TaxID=2849501 RepID=A0A975SYZ1_9ACTN|nr:hypothetical protein [Nocardioides panacis]QWZ08382.1 hypothetical protein KRR39_00395 [Nocardioides panacis]